jgi:hypothetical protein
MISAVEFETGPDGGAASVYTLPGDSSVAALIERHVASYAAFAALSRQMRDERRLTRPTSTPTTRVSRSRARSSMSPSMKSSRTEARHILHRLGLPEVPA